MSESNGIFTAVGQGLDYMINDLIIGGLDRAIRGMGSAVSNIAASMRGGDEASVVSSNSSPMESNSRDLAPARTPPVVAQSEVIEKKIDFGTIMASLPAAAREAIQNISETINLAYKDMNPLGGNLNLGAMEIPNMVALPIAKGVSAGIAV